MEKLNAFNDSEVGKLLNGNMGHENLEYKLSLYGHGGDKGGGGKWVGGCVTLWVVISY